MHKISYIYHILYDMHLYFLKFKYILNYTIFLKYRVYLRNEANIFHINDTSSTLTFPSIHSTHKIRNIHNMYLEIGKYIYMIYI